jgi:hypothetical protein
VEKDLLTETIESISNNFINGNLSNCKHQIQELGAEAPMTLAYVVLHIKLLTSGDSFVRWVSKNLED